MRNFVRTLWLCNEMASFIKKPIRSGGVLFSQEEHTNFPSRNCVEHLISFSTLYYADKNIFFFFVVVYGAIFMTNFSNSSLKSKFIYNDFFPFIDTSPASSMSTKGVLEFSFLLFLLIIIIELRIHRHRLPLRVAFCTFAN